MSTASIRNLPIPGHGNKKARKRARIAGVLGFPVTGGIGTEKFPSAINRRIEQSLELDKHGLNVFAEDPDEPQPSAGPPPEPPELAPEDRPDLERFQRPGSDAFMPPPTFAGIQSSMTPGQQRARIAALATQGGYGNVPRPREGPYAGQGVGEVLKRYYEWMALQSLTDEQGLPLADATILPVERQYLEQLKGRQLKRDSAAHFLTQLTI